MNHLYLKLNINSAPMGCICFSENEKKSGFIRSDCSTHRTKETYIYM